MPLELSRIIQDYARPRTRTDWRNGSLMFRTVGFDDLYWRYMDNYPWYTFTHSNPNVMVTFFLRCWVEGRLCGVHLLRSLSNVTPIWIRTALFMRMTEENLPFLIHDVQHYEPNISNDATRKQVFQWIFRAWNSTMELFDWMF